MAVISRLISSSSGEVAGPLLGGVELGVPQGDGGGGGQPLEQLPVVLVEDAVARELVGDLDRADGDAARDHRRGHDVAGERLGRGSTPGSKRGSSTARVTIVVRWLLGHVADEAGAHRHLGADQPLAGAAHGEPAAQHVALGDPERPAFRAERGEHPLEDLGSSSSKSSDALNSRLIDCSRRRRSTSSRSSSVDVAGALIVG